MWRWKLISDNPRSGYKPFAVPNRRTETNRIEDYAFHVPDTAPGQRLADGIDTCSANCRAARSEQGLMASSKDRIER